MTCLTASRLTSLLSLLFASIAGAVEIPSRDQVGAANLPDEIASVKAPFPMPQFKKPSFPDLVINIADQGAKPGAKVTAIIQSAIDEVHRRGG